MKNKQCTSSYTLKIDDILFIPTATSIMSSHLDIEILLDQYLSSAESFHGETFDHQSIKKHQEDDILRTVDFLYGKTMEGALAILDAAENNSISKVISTATERSAYLVKGSSSYSFRGKFSSDESYFCIVPHFSDDVPIYYCSCRSFLERNRHPVNEGTCLCKHLLAVRLMPVLKIKPVLIETVSDDDFANILMQRIQME